MKHDCHYHPGDTAKWHCDACQVDLCPRCMPDADSRKRRGNCPLCGSSLRYLAANAEVTPFWQRVPAFFRYPLKRDPLLVVAICTLVPLLLQPNLLGLIVTVVLILALFKYTYAVINHTARGKLEPPTLATAFTGDGFGIVFMQLAVFIMMAVILTTAGMLGGLFLVLLTAAFLVLALPASVILLAMERSITAAINPLKLAALMSRIGWPYFVMYAYLILLSLASGVVQDFTLRHFDPLISQPVAGFLNSAFMLIVFHMLGYLIYQYRQELGYDEDSSDDAAEDHHSPRDRSKRIDADIDIYLKNGEYSRVFSILKEALRKDPHNPARLQQMYRLLTAMDDSLELYRHHPRLLAMLSQERDARGLQTLLTVIYREEPLFRLDDPTLTVRCAEVLYQAGEFKSALKLLQDFHKRFPDSDQLAPGYLLVAQVLANGFAQWDKAVSFLTFVQRRCQQHPLHKDIDIWLEQARNQQPLKGPKARFEAVDRGETRLATGNPS